MKPRDSCAEALLKLNVGCGLTAPDGWVNIDSSWNAWLAQRPFLRWILYRLGFLSEAQYRVPWPRNVLVHDVRHGLPFRDESVSCIYASHFLEHLYRQEAADFLKECYRVFTRKGVLRVLVPDLKSLAESYLRERECKPKSSLPADSFLESMGLTPGVPRLGIWGVVSFLQKQDKNRHKWMYDTPSLRILLNEAGFTACHSLGYLESSIKCISDVEREDRFEPAICIECIK